MRRRLLVPLVALLAAGAAPASAQEAPAPEATAWFSAASGGGLAAPQPTTEESDLRVSRALDTVAFAALRFRAEGVRAGLDLAVRDLRAAGTPDVVACPTVGAAWEPGGNQPLDAAPEVDCGASTAYGVTSEDGTTLSFALDDRFQVEPGVWSIAVIPTPSEISVGPPPKVPLPFTVDLVAPEAGAFTAEPAFALPEPEETTTDDAAPGDVVVEPAPTGLAPFVPGLEQPALTTGSVGVAPLPPVDAGVAPSTAPDPALAAPRSAAVRPAAAEDVARDGTSLLAVLALLGVAAYLGRESALQRGGPRLIGGRARLAGVEPATTTVQDRPRGLGRFAAVRDAAPRRLR